jgi:hypothetical protein
MRLKFLLPLILLLTACQPAVVETEVPATASTVPTETATEVAPTATAIPATATPTDTPPTATATAVPRLFTALSPDPVVVSGPTGEWDGKYVNPGAMLYHDGRFHMFRNGFTTWPGNIQFGYMTSIDGLSWTEPQDMPLFASEAVPFAAPGADVSSVVVLADGRWVLYFHTVNRSEKSVLGLATAPDPLGPWTVNPDPILTSGSGGSWDDGDLSWPHVLPTEAGYFMYYQAEDRFGSAMSIGMAISPDGLNWEKYDDPDTTDTAFSQSDPVFSANESWEQGKVGRPVPVRTPEGWLMIYAARELNSRGIATSLDGVHWDAHANNPVIARSDFPISGSTWDTALVWLDGIFYYFMEIGSLQRTNIYLLTYEGGIP